MSKRCRIPSRLDHDDISKAQAIVARTDALGRARAAYLDASKPERNCDHCGSPYRGPAVYCSLECAQADA